MLFVARRVSPPCIVGDDCHQLRSVLDKIRENLSVSGFIANDRTHLDRAVVDGGVKGVLGGVGTQRGTRSSKVDDQILQEKENFRERHLLYPRHQTALVVQVGHPVFVVAGGGVVYRLVQAVFTLQIYNIRFFSPCTTCTFGRTATKDYYWCIYKW